MSIVSMLLKNSLKLDLKMLIPFFVTIVIILFVISSTYFASNLFMEESREPAIQKLGGDYCLYKSSHPAEFTYDENGWSEKWYKQLYEPQEILGYLQKESTTIDLCIWGKHKFLFEMNTLLIGREENLNSPKWELNSGEHPIICSLEDWITKGCPVVVLVGDSFPLQLRSYLAVGNRFEAFIPKITDTGGVMNLKGADKTVILPKDAVNIDYLNYENGRWLTLTIAAIGRDGLGKKDDSALVLPLQILQELTGANTKVNSIGINSVQYTEDELIKTIEDIVKGNKEIHSIKTNTIYTNLINGGYDFEDHANLLTNVIFLLCSLMVFCVLTVILHNRRSLDVQLIALGVNYPTLTLVVILEIFLVSIMSVLVGIGLPAIMSLIRGGKIVIETEQLLTFFSIVPYNLFIAVIVSRIMLPNRKQCLEGLRNE